MEIAIRTEELSKVFGELEVLKGISLSFVKGETNVILGASGSGKSTLLRCLNFLEIPTSGRIYINERAVGVEAPGQRNGHALHYREEELRQIRAKIGMVFQQFNLFPHMTALQNVIEAQVQVLKRGKAEATDRAKVLLAKVGLSEKAGEYPARLSGGQQQRVAIARALAMDPEIMLFDEVTSALDPELVGEVLRVMRALRDDGMTMAIVTHELGFAYHVADHVVFLHEGVVYEQGPPEEILTSPAKEKTRQFLEGHNQFRLP